MNVLVALETCALPKYAERRKLIASTWGARLKPPFTFMEFDGPSLGVGDDYQSLPAKTKAIAQYALTHDYDWLMIVDDDVFIRTDRLTIPTHGDYVGAIYNGYCCGAFYWLSRHAMEIVANASLNALTAEDQWVGGVMAQHGIQPVHEPLYVLWHCPCDDCTAKFKLPDDWIAIAFSHRWLPEEYAKLELLHG